MVTFANSDTTMTSMLTLTNQGPWKLSCKLIVSGVDLTACATATCDNNCYVQSVGQTITWDDSDTGTSSGVFTDGTYTVTGRVEYTSGGSLVIYNMGSAMVTISGADASVELTLTQARRRSIWTESQMLDIYDYFYPDVGGITPEEDEEFVERHRNVTNNHIETLYTRPRYF